MYLKVKRTVARGLAMSGAAAVKWRLLRPALYVFTYHRVGDAQACPYDRATFSCDAAAFAAQVRLIQQRFDVIGLDRLQQCARAGPEGRRPLALITFDDGYIDNYTIAYPILRSLGLSAVFFLPTAFIGARLVPWWDQIAWSIRHARRTAFTLTDCTAELSTVENVEATIRNVLRWVKARPQAPMADKIAEVAEACGVTADAAAAEPLFLNWDEARAMHAAGMDIGSHTHTHSILSHLNAADQERELRQSRGILEDELDAPIDAVAYPVGRSTCYSAATLACARAAGYRLGFNYSHGVAALPVADPLDITRLHVDGNLGARQLRNLVCFPHWR